MSRVVVEEVSGVLALYSDGTVERPTAGNPLASHVPPSNNSFVDGVPTRDVDVDTATGVWVRIYLPESTVEGPPRQKRRLPVLIHFHGSGFCVSHTDWEMYYHFYARLAKAAAAVCVSVDYRLAPEHRLPAACDGCFGVLRWLRSVAREDAEDPWLTERADFSRCFLVGESAGGNIVHQMALRSSAAAGDDRLHPVCLPGCVAIRPGFVRAERSRSEAETPLLSVEIIDKFLKLAVPAGSDKDHPVVNPMGPPAASVEGLRLPRMLVGIADRDLMRDTQRPCAKPGRTCRWSSPWMWATTSISRQASLLLAAVVRFLDDCQKKPSNAPSAQYVDNPWLF